MKGCLITFLVIIVIILTALIGGYFYFEEDIDQMHDEEDATPTKLIDREYDDGKNIGNVWWVVYDDSVFIQNYGDVAVRIEKYLYVTLDSSATSVDTTFLWEKMFTGHTELHLPFQGFDLLSANSTLGYRVFISDIFQGEIVRRHSVKTQ